ncbi:MAG: hypothetical protein ACI4TY_05625, partial [Candidatus Limosilactobacillus intestinavium]
SFLETYMIIVNLFLAICQAIKNFPPKINSTFVVTNLNKIITNNKPYEQFYIFKSYCSDPMAYCNNLIIIIIGSVK